MALFNEIVHKNSTDPKIRLEIGHQLLDLVRSGVVSVDTNSLTAFMDVMVQWLNGTNFKVALLALEILSATLDAASGHMVYHLLDNAVAIMERLGDSREQVRQLAIELLLKIMNAPGSSPQAVWDRIADGLTHKQWLVRISVMVILQQVLRTFGHSSLQLAKVVPLICRLLADPTNQVRDVATETLVHMYMCIGDKLASDIQKKQLVPQARAAALFSRFEDVKRNGDEHLSNYNKSDSFDNFGSHDAVDRSTVRLPLFGSANGAKKVAVPAQQPRPSKASMISSLSGNQKRAATSASTVKRVQTSSRYAGSAGAVDEDSFYNVFEDVPKLEIFNCKDVVAHMQKIRTVVINPNCDWDKRVESLKLIRSLLVAGVAAYDDFYTELRSLEVPIQLACKDLRSQVVREACITVAYLAEQLGPKFDHFAEQVLPVLVLLIQNSAKVVATSGQIACRFIIRNVRSARLVSVVADSCSSKSREIRRAGFEMIAYVCQQWTAAELEKSVAVLQSTICRGLADADPDARASSRKAYWCFSDNFREPAEALFRSLDAAKKRGLLGEVSHSSSSHSLFNALVTAQDATPKSALPSYMNACRVAPGVRSTSEIDTGAARRAASKQLSATKPYTPGCILANNQSLPRPSKFTTTALGLSGSHRFGSPTVAGAVSRQDSSSICSPSSNSKSISQPGSRSSSPNSRPCSSGLATFSRSRTPGPSRPAAAGSRDVSPLRTSRRMSTPDQNVAGRSLYDSDSPALLRSQRRGDDAIADSSSIGSDRFSPANGASELSTVVRNCLSSVWSERKEALMSLQSQFRGRRPMTSGELKKACDVFARLFVDPHHKTFAVFLDTLIEFLRTHHRELHDWLYILLCRLLAKQSSELLPSVQNRMQKALDTVCELFPLNLQFDALIRYLVDPVQMPSIKMKLNLLGYMVEVVQVMDPSGLTNCLDVRTALSRVVQWTGEPKSPEVRRAAQNALIALFNLNAPEFNRILNTFSKTYQDTVYRILNAHVRQSPATSTPQPSLKQNEKLVSSFELDYVHDNLKKTSKEIQTYPFSDYNAIGSSDSGIVDVVDSFLRNGTAVGGVNHAGGLLGNGNTDEDRQEDMISDILSELSNHNQRSVERQQAMTTLRSMSRDGSFTLWDEHFKTILLILLETLGDDDPRIRAYALPVLKEICMQQPQRFQNYAELTILRVLDAHKDVEREVTRAAEDCASVVASHLPSLICLRVLIPVIRNDSSPALLAALKMTNRVIESMEAKDVCDVLEELMPGILMGFENQNESSVRKASVLCLVALHNKLGAETVEPYLTSLSASKRKLLNLYIKRDQQQ